MKRIISILTASLFTLLSYFATAQTAAEADTVKRAELNQQSIYMVMSVVITIVFGLFLYLFNLDRKISKLEKDK